MIRHNHNHRTVELPNHRTAEPSDCRTAVDGVLTIDKPAGPTSHDVVQRVKRLLGARKVGHLGTLDPAATGVLPLVLGDATKRAKELAGTEKVYAFTLVFGAATDTDDDTGRVIARATVPPDAMERLSGLLPQFTGEILQRPPVYSAVKVDGERSYRRARRGERTLLEPRPVRIDALSVIGEVPGGFRMRLECHAGTYVRSLARDIGEALGCHGHASGIRRLRSGPYMIDDAVGLEELERDPQSWAARLVEAGSSFRARRGALMDR